jgi:hypothetical protein
MTRTRRTGIAGAMTALVLATTAAPVLAQGLHIDPFISENRGVARSAARRGDVPLRAVIRTDERYSRGLFQRPAAGTTGTAWRTPSPVASGADAPGGTCPARRGW